MTDGGDSCAIPTVPWWKTAVIYHVYPRAFCDSNGDGWGDLAGICSKLPYLAGLGVSAIMVSPFYCSPMIDGGYDVSDHCSVDPRFGSERDFFVLIKEAHGQGVKVLIDFVANHVSDQHPWFKAALKDVPSAKHRFIWAEKPNAWRSAIKDGSAWTFSPEVGLYYLHCFLAEQPDLNWRDKPTREAMHDILRFWLSRGVDGFRVDAAHCLIKDQNFEVRAGERSCPLAAVNHQLETLDVLAGISDVVKHNGGDRLLIGEVFLRDPDLVALYTRSGDGGLDLTLSFSFLRCSWSAAEFSEAITESGKNLRSKGAWPTWVLSSHDRPRCRTRFGGSEGRARVAATIMLTLLGTPVVYQGDELGLLDAEVPSDLLGNPAFRRGSRAPIPWTEEEDHGWGGDGHSLPFPPEAGSRNLTSLRKEHTSILNLYRELIRIRRSSPALTFGHVLNVKLAGGCLEYVRSCHDGSHLNIACNFSDRPSRMAHLAGRRMLLHSSMEGAGTRFGGFLEGETAVILE